MLPFQSMPLLPSLVPTFSLLVAGSLVIFGGCQQAGTQGGFAGSNGLAPITQLPGQPGVSGPTFPTLGPFGASTRVPPPSTGSFQGAAATSANFQSNDYGPAGYAPNGIRPMSFDSDNANSNARPGQVANAGGFGQGAVTGTGWQETSTNAFNATVPNSLSNLPQSNSGIRSGGMPVIDLTGSPPPPGYVPPASSFPSQTGRIPVGPNSAAFGPNPNGSPLTAPVSSGGFATSRSNPAPSGFSQPAANQPSFSTVDRPIQWQPSRR